MEKLVLLLAAMTIPWLGVEAQAVASAHASRFFISEAYAYKLLYRIMRERRKSFIKPNI